MSYCSNCGKPVEAADNFCRSCGRGLKDGASANGEVASVLMEYCQTAWKEASVVVNEGDRRGKGRIVEQYWIFYATAIGPKGTYIVPTVEHKVLWAFDGPNCTVERYGMDGDGPTQYKPTGSLCLNTMNELVVELSSQGWVLMPDFMGPLWYKFRRQVKS